MEKQSSQLSSHMNATVVYRLLDDWDLQKHINDWHSGGQLALQLP